MKNFSYTFILFIIATLPAIAQKQTGETLRPESFNQIVVEGNFNIHLSQGNECLLYIDATEHSTLLLINVVSKRGTLSIGYNKQVKKSLKLNPGTIDIYVTVKELKSLDISEGCTVIGSSIIHAKKLRIKSHSATIRGLNVN